MSITVQAVRQPTSSTGGSSGSPTHVVRSGETLSGIAERYGTSVAALARLNGIANPDRIAAGQSLRISGSVGPGHQYQVRSGDTLGEIAAAHGTTVEALKRLNGLRNPDLIFAGQTLQIEGPRTSRPSPVPTSDVRAQVPAPAVAPAGRGDPALGGLSQAGLEAIARRESVAGVSNRLHWPGGASGVTLGAGYDMRHRSAAEIVRDLTAIGVDRSAAEAAARGAGLSGSQASSFAASHRSAINLTQAQETALLRHTVPSYASAVANAVRVPLNQNQFDALVSFAYNIGTPAFRDSTLLRRLNAGDIQAVPGEMRRWNKSEGRVSQGLVNRREAEVAQFNTPAPARTTSPAAETTAPSQAGSTPRSGADFAARILASGDARARADLEAGRKVVVAIRTPTSTNANGGGGRYDDTIAVVQRQSGGGYSVETFRANTDPSGRYDGRYGRDINGDGRTELGALVEGSYRYTRQPGTFVGHPFFRPDATTAVRRDTNHDGNITAADGLDRTGAGRSILIHAGGRTITGSAGCQTMPVSELNRFLAALGNQSSFSYVLTR